MHHRKCTFLADLLEKGTDVADKGKFVKKGLALSRTNLTDIIHLSDIFHC